MKINNEIEQFNFITEIERAFPVEKWTIAGVHVWPLIRLKLGYYLTEEFLQISKVKKINYLKKGGAIIRIVKDIVIYFHFLFFDYKYNNNSEMADVLMLSSNGDRSIVSNTGRCFNKNLDALAMLLERKGLEIYQEEKVANEKIYYFRETPSHILNMQMLFSRIKRSIFKIMGGENKKNLPKYGEFIQYLEKSGLPRGLVSINNIDNDIIYIINLSYYFKSVLQKKNIKLAIVSDWCSEESMALFLACSELNLAKVEIDHGFSGKYCFTCCGWHKFPSHGYEFMPTLFWTWSQEVIPAIKTPENIFSSVYAGGSPMNMYWYLKKEEIMEMFREDIGKISPPDKIIVLFSLAPYPEHVYPKWIFEYIKKSSNKYFWLLRKHPLMNSELDFYEKYHYCNVNIEESSKLPLALLLQHVNIHITYNSGTLYEAAEFGIPTVILSKECKDRVDYLMECDIVKYVDNVSDFEKSLDYFLSNSKKKEKTTVDYEAAINQILLYVK